MSTTEEHKAYDRKKHQEWYQRSKLNRSKAKQRQYTWLSKTENREWFNFKQVIYIRNLTLDEYHAKLESQQECCAICGRNEEEGKLVIDHNHQTGKTRGLLCRQCNNGLGHFMESPLLMDNAKGYLSIWSTR